MYRDEISHTTESFYVSLISLSLLMALRTVAAAVVLYKRCKISHTCAHIHAHTLATRLHLQ